MHIKTATAARFFRKLNRRSSSLSAMRHQAQPDPTPRTAQAMPWQRYGHQAPNGYPETGDAWMNTGAILNRINFGMAVAANRIPGLDFAALPAIDSLRNAPRQKQVDAVVSLLLAGSASADTRTVLIKGENPLATTALDLATLAPYLPREQPERPIAGTVSGYLGSVSPEPGKTLLEMDLVVTGLRSVISGFDAGEPRPVAIGRIDLAGFLDVSPEHLQLRKLRFENGQLRLELAARSRARSQLPARPAVDGKARPRRGRLRE